MTRRLLLSHVSLAVLVLLCLEIPLGLVYSAAERDRIVSATHDEAAALASFAELALQTGRQDRDLPRQVLACAERIGGEITVVSRSRGIITSSASRTPEQASGAEVTAALAGREATDVRTSVIGGVQYLSVAVPVGHASPPAAVVRIEMSTEQVHSRVHQMWTVLGLAGLLVLITTALVALGIARWAGLPLRRLEQATAQLAAGRLTGPVTVTEGPSEIRSLATTFNQTAARLEHLLDAQRAFAGEASHQIKTPLAALRLRLDNLELAVAPTARGSLTAALTETDRLAQMVDGLLALARLDERAARPEPVVLQRICAERLQTWDPVFRERGVRLECHGASIGPVLALPGAVEQVLDNLLSNALRHSPPGGTVTVHLRHRAAERWRAAVRTTWAELHVLDEGPGMSREQRQRAFDRFWRAPGAPKGGTGLGLALVQRLIHAGGGEISLHDAPSGGLGVRVGLVYAESVPEPAAATVWDRHVVG